jgi:hypothetical protein
MVFTSSTQQPSKQKAGTLQARSTYQTNSEMLQGNEVVLPANQFVLTKHAISNSHPR